MSRRSPSPRCPARAFHFGCAFHPSGLGVRILLVMCGLLLALPGGARAAFEIRPGGDALSTHLPLMLPAPFIRGGLSSALGTEVGALVLHPFGWRELRLDALVFRDTRRSGAWGISCRRLAAGGYAEWSGEAWARASSGLGVGLFHARTAPGLELRRELGFDARETTALSLSAVVPEFHRWLALELGAHDLAATGDAVLLGVEPRGTLSARFHPARFEVRYLREWRLGDLGSNTRSDCALLLDLSPAIGLGLGFGSGPSTVKLSVEGRWGALRGSAFQTQRGLERAPTRGIAVGYRQVRVSKLDAGVDSVTAVRGLSVVERPTPGRLWEVPEEMPVFLLEADSLFSVGDSMAIHATETSTSRRAQPRGAILGDSAAIGLLASRRGWSEDVTRRALRVLIDAIDIGEAVSDSDTLHALYLDYWPSFRGISAVRVHRRNPDSRVLPTSESIEIQQSAATLSCEVKTHWTHAPSGWRGTTAVRPTAMMGRLRLLAEFVAPPDERTPKLRDLAFHVGALSGWFASGVLLPRFGNGLLGAGAESMSFTRSALHAGFPGPTVERRASAGRSLGVGIGAAGVEAVLLTSDERSTSVSGLGDPHFRVRAAELSMAFAAWRAGLFVDVLPRRSPASALAIRRDLHTTVASFELAGEGLNRMLSLRLVAPPERDRAGITLRIDERLAGKSVGGTRLRPRRFDRQLRLRNRGADFRRTLDLQWRADLTLRPGERANELRRADLEFERREGPHAHWQTLLRAESHSGGSAAHRKLRLRVATDGVPVSSGPDAALECGLEFRERKARAESRATRSGDLFWAAGHLRRSVWRRADAMFGVLGARAEVAPGSVAPRGLGGRLRLVVHDDTVAAFARVELARGPLCTSLAFLSSSGRGAETRSVFELTWRASLPRSVEQDPELR